MIRFLHSMMLNSAYIRCTLMVTSLLISHGNPGPCTWDICGTYIQSKMCGCDIDCLLHEDCCENYFIVCLKINDTDNADDYPNRGLNITPDNNYGIKDFEYKIWFKNYSTVHDIAAVKTVSGNLERIPLIDQCHREVNVNSWRKLLCELPNLDDPINILASFDGVPYVTFKNIYCGMCNGFKSESLLPWNKTAKCPNSACSANGMSTCDTCSHTKTCSHTYLYQGIPAIERIVKNPSNNNMHGNDHDNTKVRFGLMKPKQCTVIVHGIDVLFNFDYSDITTFENHQDDSLFECSGNQILVWSLGRCIDVRVQCFDSPGETLACANSRLTNKTGQIYGTPNRQYYIKYFMTVPIRELFRTYSTDKRMGYFLSHFNSQFEKVVNFTEEGGEKPLMTSYEQTQCSNRTWNYVNFIKYERNGNVSRDSSGNNSRTIESFKPLLRFPEFDLKQCDDTHELRVHLNESFAYSAESTVMKISFRSDKIQQIKNLLEQSFSDDIIPDNLTIILSNVDDRPLHCKTGETTLLCDAEFTEATDNQSAFLYLDGSLFASLLHIPYEEVLFSTEDVPCRTLSLVCLHFPVDLNCETVELHGNITAHNDTSVVLNGTEFNVTGSVFVVRGDILYICASNLTNSMKPLGQSIRAIVSNVLLGVSALSLLVTIIVYISCKKLLNLPGKCLVAFATCLMFAQILLFLTSTGHEELCYAVGVFLHWFWLASFLWVAIISFDMKRTFANNKPSGEPSKTFLRYLVVAFLSPTLFVAICVLVDNLRPGGFHLGYGSDGLCWISVPMATVYMFAVPVLLSLTYDVFCFISIIVAIERQTDQSSRTLNRKPDKKRLMAYVRIASILGLTWVFGFLSAFTGNEALGYIYVITNSSQGIFVAASFLVNKRVYVSIKEKLISRNHIDQPTTESREFNTVSTTV